MRDGVHSCEASLKCNMKTDGRYYDPLAVIITFNSFWPKHIKAKVDFCLCLKVAGSYFRQVCH